MDSAGKALAELRRGAGYTQKSAAAALGVSVFTIHKWESGGRSPSKRNLKKLLDAYKVNGEAKNAVVMAVTVAA